MKKVYSFKIFYIDGSCKVLGGKAQKPEYLCYEFDGMVGWDEYNKLTNAKLTVKEVLQEASKIFKSFYKNLAKIEIINIENNEVVDFIDC